MRKMYMRSGGPHQLFLSTLRESLVQLWRRLASPSEIHLCQSCRLSVLSNFPPPMWPSSQSHWDASPIHRSQALQMIRRAPNLSWLHLSLCDRIPMYPSESGSVNTTCHGTLQLEWATARYLGWIHVAALCLCHDSGNYPSASPVQRCLATKTNRPHWTNICATAQYLGGFHCR